MKKPKKKWNRTGVQNLLRHESGVYYARLYAGGKENWESLETKTLSVAKVKLAELKRQRPARSSKSADDSKMTMQAAAEIRLLSIQRNTKIKDSTKHYWDQCFKALAKSWDGFETQEVRKVRIEQAEAWASSFAKQASPGRFNNILSALRQTLDVGIERGLTHSNPASRIKRLPLRSKNLKLPSNDEFHKLVAHVRTRGGRFSKPAADLIEFLAYSGCRLGEAANVQWCDCNFTKKEILIKGDPENRTKNGEIRRAPMNGQLIALLKRLKAEDKNATPTSMVMRVNEAQKSLDRACEFLEIARITHHDLRHFFITRCIECKVDIPTIASWVGHKDGGALIMKTYGHLRNEHSQAEAAKVQF